MNFDNFYKDYIKGKDTNLKFIKECPKIKINDVNELFRKSPDKLVTDSENYYDSQLDMTADSIINNGGRYIFLTGPSSSGKTTTAKMIVQRLEERGKKAERISLDNFYKSHDQIPVWENGRKNYETIDSLDLEYFALLFKQLEETGHAKFPIFDFIAGNRSGKTFDINLNEHEFIIMEGIHALNPKLTEGVSSYGSMKIYVSPHSIFVNELGETVLLTEDLRLIRRIIRDRVTRGASASRTIGMWQDVIWGERQFIRPFRNYADIHINSTHFYEPMVYRRYLLQALSEGRLCETGGRLLKALDSFDTIDESLIPKSSLLREFIPLKNT